MTRISQTGIFPWIYRIFCCARVTNHLCLGRDCRGGTEVPFSSCLAPPSAPSQHPRAGVVLPLLPPGMAGSQQYPPRPDQGSWGTGEKGWGSPSA